MVSEPTSAQKADTTPERSPYRFRGDEVFHIKPGTYIARVYARWLSKDGHVPFRILKFHSSEALIRVEMLKGNLICVGRATPPTLTKEPIPKPPVEDLPEPEEEVTKKPAAPTQPVAPPKRHFRK